MSCTCELDLRGLELWEASFGEQEGLLPEEAEPRLLSVNQENGTKEPELRDGLSEGSLRDMT